MQEYAFEKGVEAVSEWNDNRKRKKKSTKGVATRQRRVATGSGPTPGQVVDNSPPIPIKIAEQSVEVVVRDSTSEKSGDGVILSFIIFIVAVILVVLLPAFFTSYANPTSAAQQQVIALEQLKLIGTQILISLIALAMIVLLKN